jgi:hypothetical protein
MRREANPFPAHRSVLASLLTLPVWLAAFTLALAVAVAIWLVVPHRNLNQHRALLPACIHCGMAGPEHLGGDNDGRDWRTCYCRPDRALTLYTPGCDLVEVR